MGIVRKALLKKRGTEFAEDFKGKGWWPRFTTRWPALALRRGDTLAVCRTEAVTTANLKEYYDLLKTTLEEHGLMSCTPSPKLSCTLAQTPSTPSVSHTPTNGPDLNNSIATSNRKTLSFLTGLLNFPTLPSTRITKKKIKKQSNCPRVLTSAEAISLMEEKERKMKEEEQAKELRKKEREEKRTQREEEKKKKVEERVRKETERKKKAKERES